MNKRILKVIFTKGGSGSVSPKLSLPIKWVRELGIDEENREVVLELDKDKIIISKNKK